MHRCLIVLLLLLAAPALRADLLTNAISVQGVVSENGEAADGIFDLRVTPYPERNTGLPLLPAQELDNVLIVNGAFTTKVDFGNALFLGDIVFLEIALRAGNSTGAYEALSPRLELTAAPYALKPAPASVTDIEIANEAVGSPQLLDGDVRTVDLDDGAVSTLKLADNSVATAKLQDGAVSASKLGNAAVAANHLAAGSVGSAAIADGAIAGADLGSGVVGSGALAADAVDSSKILDGGIASADLGSGIVGSSALATDAVDSGKILDGSIAGADLGNGVVGPSALATDAVDSGKILDGSIAAVDLAPGLLSVPSWNLGGNAISSGQFLGTTNGMPLDLRSDVGVTVNGTRFNNNTEFTIRGSPVPAETNADFTLWPRGGSAFFNLSAIGGDPATSMFSIQSIGTSPFTGYDSRLVLTFDGALGVGGSNPTPVGSFHVTRADVGVEAGELAESFEIIAEDADAQAALFSNNGGAGGSSLIFGEQVSNAFNNAWGLWRATGGVTNVPLHFSYGGSSSAPANSTRMSLYADGSLFAGNVPLSTTPTTSFVFADGSSVGAFNPTAANQFLVRATGGFGLNRPPLQSGYEMSLASSAAGAPMELSLREQDATTSFVVTVDGTDNTDARFRILRRSDSGGLNFLSRLWIGADGFVGLNAGFSDPGFPLIVGSNTSNGNGARLTATGIWTNGSSRSFKTDFSAIDPTAILNRLVDLPVLQWRFKGDDPSLHIGPIAEDFRAAFGLGDDERYIGTVDADGVALAAIQGLNAKLERENAELRATLAQLAERLTILEQGQ